MINFPNSKINIGLNIVSKRPDGYHNIETIFYPIPFEDILEILPAKEFEFVNLGVQIDCPVENNLCYKAFRLIEESYKISPVKIILYKNVPYGTGLGSGSSDAAHTLILLDKIFNLKLEEKALIDLASLIGADCAFFIVNKPIIATCIGNVFEEVVLSLKNKWIVLCLPEIKISTASAYRDCVPAIPEKRLSEIIKLPVAEWKNYIKNDFEKNIFQQFPILRQIKSELYENGANYAQMSGSGSAIFGIFDSEPYGFQMKSCSTFKIFKL